MSRQVLSERLWSVPVAVADIPDTGRQVELVADPATREAIARSAGLLALPRLEATFELTRQGTDAAHVVGRVGAIVRQSCVVTLEPVESEIDEAVDLRFTPAVEASREEGGASFNSLDAEEPPEPLHDGTIDLGAIAIEFLLLGIDPYQRKPGAVFDAPQVTDDSSGRPFAALAALKKDPTSKGE